MFPPAQGVLSIATQIICGISILGTEVLSSFLSKKGIFATSGERLKWQVEVSELNLGLGCLYRYSPTPSPFPISDLPTYIDSICDGFRETVGFAHALEKQSTSRWEGLVAS